MDSSTLILFRRYIVLLVFGCSVFGQMVDPAIDEENKPFSYFSQPTDVIGVMDAREGSLVTPEGYLYCGAGEFMFFTGDPPAPVSVRIKTLEDGYLPVVKYTYSENGLDYHFSMLAVTLDGQPESPLVNLVKVTVVNTTTMDKAVRFSTAVRYQNDSNTDWGIGDYRFGRALYPDKRGQFEQAGESFDLEAVFAFDDNRLTRNGKILYEFENETVHDKVMTLKMGYNEEPFRDPMPLWVTPTTPVGIVKHEFMLNPGKTQSLEFKVPYLPLEQTDENLNLLDSWNYEKGLDWTKAFWNAIVNNGMTVELPEEKVTNTFKASLIYDLIARDKIDGKYYQKVNEFQYDAFWIRDAAFISEMYLLTGYPEYSRQVLEVFNEWQDSTGNYLSHGGQFDGWGQAMWAFGQYLEMTQDKEFIRNIWPNIELAFEWLINTRHNDPEKLLPVTTPGDNEQITGRVTGHNIWALAGLMNIIEMANALGFESTRYEEEYNDYLVVFKNKLQEVAIDGTIIPPGLDQKGGNDWGNLLSVYPEKVLDPSDKMVKATLEAARSKYAEGLMTYDYGRYLHHYLTIRNMNTALILGEQEEVINELNSVLVHTSSTQAGFEFSIRPWKTRDFGMNLSPHGWFAAEFRTVLRNMLVREDGDNLHLCSALSPEWLKRSGAGIAVKNAPTKFGNVSFDIRLKGYKAYLTISDSFTAAPDKIFFHIPWYTRIKKVRSGKTIIPVRNGKVEIPTDTKELEIVWSIDRKASHSYSKAVNDYKSEYKRRYDRFIHNLTEQD